MTQQDHIDAIINSECRKIEEEKQRREIDVTRTDKYPVFPKGKKLFKYRGVKEIKRLMKYYALNEELSVYFTTSDKFNDPYDIRIPNVIKESKKFRKIIVCEVIKYYSQYWADNDTRYQMCRKELWDTLEISDWDKWNKKVYEIKMKNSPEATIPLGEVLESFEKTNHDEHQKRAQEARNQIKVCCFSEEIDSPGAMLLWGHYANNHTGICYEYDEESLKKSIVRGRSVYDRLFKVQYDDEENTLFYDNKERYRKYADDELSDEEEVYLAYDFAVTKGQLWSYEKEWRALLIDYEQSETGITVPLRPSRIYLGVNISEENRKIVCSIAKQQEIEVWQMKLDESNFSLSSYRII